MGVLFVLFLVVLCLCVKDDWTNRTLNRFHERMNPEEYYTAEEANAIFDRLAREQKENSESA